jgi:hypothetical protein
MVPTVVPSFSERCPLWCHQACRWHVSVGTDLHGTMTETDCRKWQPVLRLRDVMPYRITTSESGGHGARTRNPLRGTTFPVWPLTIRLPSVNGYRIIVCDTLSRLSRAFLHPVASGCGKGLWRLVARHGSQSDLIQSVASGSRPKQAPGTSDGANRQRRFASKRIPPSR